MKELHVTPEVYILNTVSHFRVEFHGNTEDLTDPKNKVEIRVFLQMVRGKGKPKIDEDFCRVQHSSVVGTLGDDDGVRAIFDPENKTLLGKHGPIKIANKKSVLAAIDKVVKEELTTKKFGNMVNEDDYPFWL